MAGQLTSTIPASLEKLKRLGDKHMADAHQAVEDARRLAHDTAEVVAESQRLHNRFHQVPPVLRSGAVAAEAFGN